MELDDLAFLSTDHIPKRILLLSWINLVKFYDLRGFSSDSSR